MYVQNMGSIRIVYIYIHTIRIYIRIVYMCVYVYIIYMVYGIRSMHGAYNIRSIYRRHGTCSIYSIHSSDFSVIYRNIAYSVHSILKPLNRLTMGQSLSGPFREAVGLGNRIEYAYNGSVGTEIKRSK